MGGQSSQQQQSQTVSQPWQPAQAALTGILGSVGGINPALTSGESNAIGGLTNNAGFLSQFTPQVTANATNLLNGGGATSTTPMINDAYAQYQKTLNPIATGSTNPWDTPGFADAMSALNSDITSQTNGMFAGAGRDLSGMNVQTLARGLAQGEGGLIQNQYNQNLQNQMNAANSLYGAGNTTGGILAGLNQQDLANRQAGTGAATTAQQFSNDPFMQALSAAAAARGIPLSTLQQMAGIVTPIAGLGGQTNSNSSGTSTMSGAQQFATIAGGLGKLWG